MPAHRNRPRGHQGEPVMAVSAAAKA
jgi:hypothetical protein